MYSLHQINSQIQQVINSADENGEIDGQAFDNLQIAKQEKQLNIIKFIKHLEAEDSLYTAEIERIKKLQAMAEKRKEWLKKYIEESMRIDGVDTLDFTLFKAKIRKNPPRVVIEDLGLLPAEYMKQKIVFDADKAKIKEDMKAGKVIAGCAIEQTERLEIK